MYKKYCIIKEKVRFCGEAHFLTCAKHGTNLASESLATGIYRQV